MQRHKPRRVIARTLNRPRHTKNSGRTSWYDRQEKDVLVGLSNGFRLNHRRNPLLDNFLNRRAATRAA
jgi:hypothetical protein